MQRTGAWKQNERRVAKLLNGQRLGATGVSNEDVSTDKLSIECKHRKALPAWLVEPLAGIRKHAEKQGKTGIVCWHELGRHDSLVVMSLSDFKQLVSDVTK